MHLMNLTFRMLGNAHFQNVYHRCLFFLFYQATMAKDQEFTFQFYMFLDLDFIFDVKRSSSFHGMSHVINICNIIFIIFTVT